jgi:hypothetical protein
MEFNTNIFEQFNSQWALVCAGTMEDHNAMTISWGGMGTLWGKPVVTVYVKPCRHTYQYMNRSEYFTVSFYDDTYRPALALMGSLSGRDTDKDKEAKLQAQVREENEAVLFQLKQYFFVEQCPLGELPYDILPVVKPHARVEIPKNFLTMHYLENYPDTSFLIGIVNGEEHLKWILGRDGGKRDDAYNVRIGKDVPGGVVKSRDEIRHAKFVLLYLAGKENEGVYKVFRVKNIGEMSKMQMVKTGYIDPHYDSYLCYFFDEEVTLGNININKIIEDDKKAFIERTRFNHVLEKYPEGHPIYLEGRQLINYRF